MSKIQTALKEGLSACKEIFERDYFGNHTVKLSDFDPIKKRFERAEQEESKLRTDNDALKRRNEWLESEVTHWKANHADLKERLYVATHRTDLPSDRFPIFEQLKAENKKLRIIMMSASKKLNSSEDCSNLPQQLRDAALCNDINFISQDTVRMDYLESMCVEVRTPLRYGSQALFHAQTVSDDEDPHKNDIRDQIDAHIKNKP